MISDLDNFLNNTSDIRIAQTRLRHFTHPKAFKMYKLNQSKLIQASGTEVTSTKVRNHIIYNAMVAKKNPELVESVLDSSLKLIEAKSSPLSQSDKIHCLLQLSLMCEEIKAEKKLRRIIEGVLLDTNTFELTHECAVDALMLIVHSEIYKQHDKVFRDILKDVCSSNRIYNIEELRGLIVMLNSYPELYQHPDVVKYSKILY